MADGSIIIDTKINTNGVEVGTREIKSALEGTTRSVKDYGNSVQQWIDSYSAGMDSASKISNEFKREIESLSKKLEGLENKGLYFGDEEYDNTYLKLQKVQQALKDYKKELTAPTPNALPLDTSSLEGKVKKLSLDLQKLKDGGKTFGDTEYDQTALALKRAEQALSDYKNELFKTDAQREKEAELAKKQAAQQENLNQKLQETKQKEAEAAAESERLAAIGKNAKISSPLVIKLREEIERLSLRQKELQKAGVGSGYQEYDRNALLIEKMNTALKKYQSKAQKAEKSTKKMNTALNGTKKSTDKARFGIGKMLAMSVLYSTVFRAISTVASGLKEGTDNLAQYSDDTNKALSLLMSRLTQLKNSFATAFSPIIEYVAPALAKFISLLAEAVTWTSQLLAAITGKSTFVKAVQVQQDYADSLDKSKDKTDELKEATEKTIAPFDTLIQLQKTGQKQTSSEIDNELKPSEMFETVEVSNQMKKLAEEIKEIFSNLFLPLKQSWEMSGPEVVNSVKNAFSAVKQLAKDVSASFMQVWNAEGYGKAITNDLLITFSNLVQTIANLVTQFDKAWVSGNTGTSIIRHLGDIVLEVTGFFRSASESVKNWASNINFSPLLKSFDKVLVSLKPIVKEIGNLMLWLLDNVLLPVSSWAIEQAIPAAFDLIAASLEFISTAISVLQPLGVWLWNEFLKPIGEWAGKVFIAAMQKITELLSKFSKWVQENRVAIENITLAVGAFFAAWAFANFISGIAGLVSSLGGFMGIAFNIIGVIAQTVTKINILSIAIGGIISVIAILAKNWKNMSPTEKVVSGILAAAAAVAILAVALGAVKGAAGAALIAGAIAAGVAAATIAVNAGKRAAYSQGNYGGRSRSGSLMSSYAGIPYNPPMLATGTVVPPRAGISYFGIGDNNHEPEVVSPLSTIKQALKEAIEENGINGGGKNIQIDMYVKDQVFATAVYKANNQEKQRVGVRMVSKNG